MRGSVEYQTAQLTKVIFQEGAKKEEKNDPKSEYFNKVSSYQTMASYRQIWNNFFHYLREHWGINNCEKIEGPHIAAYMDYKIEYYPAKQYLEKISAAMGKLEMSLKYYTKNKYGEESYYDFSVRQKILNSARNLKQVADNYHNRAYADPIRIIDGLIDEKHRLAATIQLEGGARIEGVGYIKKDQLKGYDIDSVTGKEIGVIETKEKGGKTGDVLISRSSYDQLKSIILKKGSFRLKKLKYLEDIRNSCTRANVVLDGSHGFRWNFAQRRLFEYAKAGYTYEQSLQTVSYEMKHNRASITEHYFG
ncbi:hypothetical protein [Sulfurovum sp. TSL1]|uniref:hypothetical protein n=1 Tax=Sulfurovum sp. TSL1 TaxID=2826994 RepID=UPI001CC4A1E1|nr:hypothetical protein [Sulfurovum sp. TSL1]GIT98815.1 hypothetical protein TSL1_16360 [Sulfurovum sp. TSL1]